MHAFLLNGVGEGNDRRVNSDGHSTEFKTVVGLQENEIVCCYIAKVFGTNASKKYLESVLNAARSTTQHFDDASTPYSNHAFIYMPNVCVPGESWEGGGPWSMKNKRLLIVSENS